MTNWQRSFDVVMLTRKVDKGTQLIDNYPKSETFRSLVTPDFLVYSFLDERSASFIPTLPELCFDK